MRTLFVYRIIFVFLGCLVLLGDEKQSIVLLVSSAGVLCLYFYDWYYQKKTYQIEKKHLLVWLLVAFSVAISAIDGLSFGFAVTEAIKYVNAYLLFLYFSNHSELADTNMFLKVFRIWALVLICISWVFMLFPTLQKLVPLMNLLYKAYGHNHIVNILFFVLPLSVYTLVSQKTTSEALYMLILILSIVTSSSIGALILSLLFIAWYFMFENKYKKALVFLCVLSVIFCLSLFSTQFTLLKTPSQSFYKQKTHTLESRIGFWRQAAGSIKEHPLIGSGPGSFYLVSKKYQLAPNTYSWFAHSYPLQVLVELGIFGTVILGALFYTLVFYRVFPGDKKAQHSLSEKSMLLGIFLVLLYSFIEMNLDFMVVWILLWICIGIINAHQTHTKDSTRMYATTASPLLFVLGAYYFLGVIGTALQSIESYKSTAAVLLPYNTSVLNSYLTTEKQLSNVSSLKFNYFRSFHAKNPEILLSLAPFANNDSQYREVMRTVLVQDPQNRLAFETYISKVLNQGLSDELLYTLTQMLLTISKNEKVDTNFLFSRWAQIQQCFTGNTLLWNDSPSTDTYQAKSFYYSALCLLNIGNYGDAKTLLKIAVDSNPGWSTIYIDYAALMRWKYNDGRTAANILTLCRKNNSAKKHCEEFSTETLPQHSLQDETIKFIQ